MNGFLFSLLGLTAALTVCGGSALLFRLSPAGRSGRWMSAVWAAVLLLALIPLHLPASWMPTALFGEAGSEALVELPAILTPASALSPIAPLTTPPSTPEAQTSVFVPAPSTSQVPDLRPPLIALWVCGVVIMLLLALRRNRRLSAMLRACSAPCADAKMLAHLADLACRAGLRRSPELRLLDPAIPLPPCTAGFFRPCIYLPATLPATRDGRAAIYAHELCHIRRGDIWRKLFALAALSVHWFNPIAHALLPRVYEDLEPACDRDALCLLGGEPARIGYMQTLLEVAGNTRTPDPNAALFFATLSRTGKTMKRRFLSMKRTSPTRARLCGILALLLIGAMLIGSSIIFNACIPARAAAESPLEALTPLTERIVRYHYGLAPEDEITLEMLEKITALKLSVSSVDADIESLLLKALAEDKLLSLADMHLPDDASADLIAWTKTVVAGSNGAAAKRAEERIALAELLADKTLVSFNVNYIAPAVGSYSALVGEAETFRFIPRRFFEAEILAQIPDEWNRLKLGAFFNCKDASEFDGRDLDILLATFPGIGEMPTYIFDPSATAADLLQTYFCFSEHGILAPQLLDTPIIDTTSIYVAFPNLTTLELVGLTEAN